MQQQKAKPRLEIREIKKAGSQPVVEPPAPAPVEQKSKAKKKITIVPTGKASAPADGKKKILVPVGKGKGKGGSKGKGKHRKSPTFHVPEGKKYQAIVHLSGQLRGPILPPPKGPATAKLVLEDNTKVKVLIRGRRIKQVQKMDLPMANIWILYPQWRQPGKDKPHEQVYELVAWNPTTADLGAAIVRGNLSWIDTENGYFTIRVGRNEKVVKGKDNHMVKILGVLPETVKRWEFIEVRCSIVGGLLQYQGMIEDDQS